MDDLEQNTPSAEPAVAEALDQYAKGEMKAAISTAEGALDSSSDTVGLLLVIGMAKRRLGRQREACKSLEDALQLNPDRSDIWTILGMCRRDLAEREQAVEALKKAISLSATNSKAVYQLAVVYQELGRLEDAIEHFKAYTQTEQGAKHALAWSLMGVAFRASGDMQASVEAITRAIEIDPEDIPTRNALVISHYLSGDEGAAIKEGKIALAMKDTLATVKFKALGLSDELPSRRVPFNASDRTKNIIAFSLWGDDPVYTHGAIINAQMAPNIYPSWRCRFYCDDTVPRQIRKELRRLGSEVVLVKDPALRELKTIWRFLAADDPSIDRFICRDADSRLNVQEAIAVEDWIKSGQPFHVMRDHIYHMEVMLAGLWGGQTGVLPNVRELSNNALGYRRNRWNDQEFLRDVIWPMIRDRARVHDSFYGFRGAGDFPPFCRLPDKIHVGGAIKKMPEWPLEHWSANPEAE